MASISIYFVPKDMISSFLMTALYSFEYMYYSFFIQSSVVEHLYWSHVLIIVDNAAVNIGLLMPSYKYIYVILLNYNF